MPVEGKAVSGVAKQQHDGLHYLKNPYPFYYKGGDWPGEATYSDVWTVAKEKSPSA